MNASEQPAAGAPSISSKMKNVNPQ